MIKKSLFFGFIFAVSISLYAPNSYAQVFMKNTVDSVSYYLGYSMGVQIANMDIEGFNIDAMAKGVQEAISNGKNVDERKVQELQMFLNNYFMGLQARAGEKVMKEGRDFLEANGKKQGVVTLPSGLQYKVIKEGTGAKPTKEDMVDVIYHGTLIDGTVFDSSKDRGDAATFNVNGVIAGFSEALTLMNEGSIWEVYIPFELGYGERGAGAQIKPYSALIFEINLVKINKAGE